MRPLSPADQLWSPPSCAVGSASFDTHYDSSPQSPVATVGKRGRGGEGGKERQREGMRGREKR